MKSSELVALIKGLYEAGVPATVSVGSDGSVEVDVEPPSFEVEVVQTPLFEILPDTPQRDIMDLMREIQKEEPVDRYPEPAPGFLLDPPSREFQTPLFETRYDPKVVEPPEDDDLPAWVVTDDGAFLRKADGWPCTDPDSMNGAADGFGGSD